jgi:uncharacterized protein (TIGR03382 family)
VPSGDTSTRDGDGDGFAADDCDDTDPATYPGAPEALGDPDHDCDGLVGCWRDVDGDGYTVDTEPVTFEPVLPGASGDDRCGRDSAWRLGDCQLLDPDVNPGALEFRGAGDLDCDGIASCFVDADGDGVGSVPGTAPVPPGTGCPAGFAGPQGDCDDAEPAAYPGATEVIGNDLDEDCDGELTCYDDFDGDGYGLRPTTTLGPSCTDPGLAAVDGDCHPADPGRFPGAPERPGDDLDDDCDGTLHCHVDGDGDGFGAPLPYDAGDPSTYVVLPLGTCDQPALGAADDVADCDDADPDIYFGAPEILANDVDEDCDGVPRCYRDDDGDGFGGDGTPVACGRGALVDGDCDDGDESTFPGAPETVAGVDQDCDGDRFCFVDRDLDGAAGEETAVFDTEVDCDAERGFGSRPTDCDDGTARRVPQATEWGETCGPCTDEIDNDCDDLVDADDPDCAPCFEPEPTPTPSPTPLDPTTDAEDPSGCGCSGGPRPASAAWLVLLLAVSRRRAGSAPAPR